MTPKPDEQAQNSARLYEARQLEAIARRWDSKAVDWDRSLRDPCCHLNEDHAYERFFDRLLPIIQDRADFCRGHGVIDVGCATGLVLGKTISAFAWGIGVDISPRMIEAATVKQISRAKFVVGDCFNLSTLCAKAGAVLSRGVLLSHYGQRNALDLLKSARSVLVENGFVYMDFLNLASQGRFDHSPENKTYYAPESVSDLIDQAGFKQPMIFAEPDRRVGLVFAIRG